MTGEGESPVLPLGSPGRGEGEEEGEYGAGVEGHVLL